MRPDEVTQPLGLKDTTEHHLSAAWIAVEEGHMESLAYHLGVAGCSAIQELVEAVRFGLQELVER
jgi:hypothetical protein